MRRGMNSGEMQKNNRMLVFRTLLENGSMTRTELASCIGLQKATITNIINEFLELGIVGIIWIYDVFRYLCGRSGIVY